MVVGILEGIVVKEWFAGLDIHMEKLYGTVLNNHGEVVVQGSLPYTKIGIRSFFAGMWKRFMVSNKDLLKAIFLT